MTWRAMSSRPSILALCAPLALILSIASKVYELQEDDEALVQEEKWKMTLDGVDSWQKHAAMADLGDVVRRRNQGAWPRVLGVRCGAGTANAATALAVRPPTCCSPRHRMPCNSRHEDTKCVGDVWLSLGCGVPGRGAVRGDGAGDVRRAQGGHLG